LWIHALLYFPRGPGLYTLKAMPELDAFVFVCLLNQAARRKIPPAL
jgi:hypothetical protein